MSPETLLEHPEVRPDEREPSFPVRVERRVARSQRLNSALVFTGLLGIILLGLWITGAFRTEFADYPDEAAHYVTGLLIHDYIAGFHYLSPLQFAENFYIHYPKVALGHWPPVFYLIQAGWTLLFSTSHTSLMFLMAALAALLAFVIYRILLPEVGQGISLCAAILFAALPLVQLQAGRLMDDILVTLFMVMAATWFGRFLDTGSARAAIGFGIWSSVAVLTKESAFALVLVPILGIACTRKWKMLHRPALWCSAGIVLVTGGPWSLWTLRMSQNGLAQRSLSLSYFLRALYYFWNNLPHSAGWLFSLLALLGLAVKGIALFRGENVRGIWPSLLGLFCGCFLVFCLIPAGFEPRYLLPALAAMFPFVALGVVHLLSRLPLRRWRAAVAAVLLLIGFATAGFSFPPSPVRGYAALANLMLSNLQLRGRVILICSDPEGEGGFISEMAMREKRPGHFILRASKVLASSDWTGHNARPLFHSASEVLSYIDSIPLSTVIIDRSASAPDLPVYENFLLGALQAPSHHWRLLATSPVWKKGIEDPRALEVYVRTTQIADSQNVIRVSLNRELGKTLTFRLPQTRHPDSRGPK